jgi:hypothetical protein
MFARSPALAATALLGGVTLASMAPAHAEPLLDGTYRLDYVGAQRTINGAPNPTTDTSANYSFTSSCAGEEGCVANAILLNTTDREAVSAHNPNLTLKLVDGAWQLSLPYDSRCGVFGDSERNQLLTWSLTPQGGTDALSGYRIVATVGNACPGDEPGTLSQPMTATRVGSSAPGILPSW